MLVPSSPSGAVATRHARSTSVDRGRGTSKGRKIRLGICAREKKTNAKPMTQVLSRFDREIFDIVVFGDECILNQDIERWPVVDCLMAWYSQGFPLEKALEYVKLRQPFCINDLRTEYILRDRRKFYEVLKRALVPTPTYVVVSREGPLGPTGPSKQVVVETEDWIEVDGVTLLKPFVEKPVNAEDHNIYIYYPRRLGGGSKRLFRKEANVSSRFYPDENSIRREGSFIYEEFLMTQGTDLKVYLVGPDYAHAEARKSPVVDGIVQRDEDGKEVRFPVLLMNREKDLARRICLAFRHNVCGFDLLRTPSMSYVCDVNGWSFVKKSNKYYDDVAQLIQMMMLRAVAPHRLNSRILLNTSPPAGMRHATSASHSNGVSRAEENNFKKQSSSDVTEAPKGGDSPSSIREGGVMNKYNESPEEELRCVIAVIRHGDRTPKQKMKMPVTHQEFLSIHTLFSRSPREETTLKSALQLQKVLDATRSLIAMRSSLRRSQSLGSETESGLNSKGVAATTTPEVLESNTAQGSDGDEKYDHHEDLDKLLQMKDVLEKGGHFSGINRKVQLKPTKWKDAERTSVSECLLVLKWGGVLTHAGKRQAELLGQRFRSIMYPGESVGLLRLHSTYRHDLKIYSSDEGRVQMTAAAFVKGFLDLEGELTPILASLVKTHDTGNLLDHADPSQDTSSSLQKRLKMALTTSFSATVGSSAGGLPGILEVSETSGSAMHSRAFPPVSNVLGGPRGLDSRLFRRDGSGSESDTNRDTNSSPLPGHLLLCLPLRLHYLRRC